MLYLFIDTNIIMHYRPPAEIAWLEIANASECTLVVTPTLVDELEEKKRGTSKAANRAQNFLKKIFECLQNPEQFRIRSDVGMLLIAKRPSRAFMDENNLVFEHKDQQLLASILDFRRGAKSEDEIVFCTSDIGAMIRADAQNIKTLQVPEDSYKLSNELTEEGKELKDLRLKVARYENQTPAPALYSSDGNSFVTLIRQEPINATLEDYKAVRIEDLIENYPQFDLGRVYERSPFFPFNEPPSKEEMRAYNGQLSQFYKNHDGIFKIEYEAIVQDTLVYPLNLLLEINGSVPARNVEVKLKFPKGLWAGIARQNALSEIDYPEPPYKPKYRGDNEDQGLGLARFAKMPRINEAILRQPFNTTDTLQVLKEESRFVVAFPLGTIRHGKNEQLAGIAIKFNDWSAVKGFAIEYEIHADNLPEPIYDKINVRIERPKEIFT